MADLTDREIREEVERRGLLLNCDANDPADGYFASEPGGYGDASLREDAQPRVWREERDGEVFNVRVPA